MQADSPFISWYSESFHLSGFLHRPTFKYFCNELLLFSVFFYAESGIQVPFFRSIETNNSNQPLKVTYDIGGVMGNNFFVERRGALRVPCILGKNQNLNKNQV